MANKKLPLAEAQIVLVIAKFIFVASIDEIVMVYVKSSFQAVESQLSREIVDVSTSSELNAGGLAVVILTYHVE